MPTDAEIEFESQWKSADTPPEVFAFLAARQLSGTDETLPLLLLDQRYRWQSGMPLKVEDYLARLPDVTLQPAARLRLVLNEYRLRQDSEKAPTIEEFVTRFSDMADILRRQLQTEKTLARDEVADEKTLIGSAPRELVGRYRLGRVLGRGTFGCVYLGTDEELQRPVAVKVPNADRFETSEEADSFLHEARLVAGLDHPHIVPVHDVGRTTDGAIYIVSKFVEGVTLMEKLRGGRLAFRECVRMLIPIAEALHHAHERQLIHLDVKPGNILIEDRTGSPYITDFGLAVRDQNVRLDGLIAGTPSYMSPEQARGEGHRICVRSDVFALGAILYRMLTGRKAFFGATTNEVLHKVVSVNPPLPSTVDPAVPPELERVCLKALAKQISSRHRTAGEFADDLRQWEANDKPMSRTATRTMVPHGLRSFNSDDADFFWDLLPGTRTRDGMPESVHFWIRRLEEMDSDATFSVGLIYGPSGCGKSSLMKAGVLPHLCSSVKTVYVEATAIETELRILRGLRKRQSSLPANLSLAHSLQWLRQHGDGKTLVIIDQFEQWLHAHELDLQGELISAFRQCDGGSVQAVVMIRDGFAMPAARFMDALDIPIVQGTNFATVDLFDETHAAEVLGRFGQAFGKLPPNRQDFTLAQSSFLKSVAEGLSNGGQVVPVHLALFAEMIESKPWEVSTLREVGGTTGVGVNFLEETFSSRSANPSHRKHQQAAREVLKALLPEIGSDIKGHMRSREDLLQAAGYQDRDLELNDLLRVLDGDLRLITPTDPEGFHSDSDSSFQARHYQLTHDYLVPSLREWLNRQQKETRRGRAQLCLEERSSLWSVHREKRQLPSLFEWLEISRFVPRSQRGSETQLMMSAATSQHASRLFMTSCALVMLAAAGLFVRYTIQQRNEANRLDNVVSNLWRAAPDHLPSILMDLDGSSDSWREEVTEIADDVTTDADRRIRAMIALASTDTKWLSQLTRHLTHCSPAEHAIVLERIQRSGAAVSDLLWERLQDKMQPQEIVRLSSALAQVDAQSPRWQEFSPTVVQALVKCDALFSNEWLPELVRVIPHLGPHLESVCLNTSESDSKRLMAVSLISALSRQQPEYPTPERLQEIVIAKEAYLRDALAATMLARREKLLPAVIEAADIAIPEGDSEAIQQQISRAASAIIVAQKLGHDGAFLRAMGQTVDPRVRTQLINRFAETAATTFLDTDVFNQQSALVRQGLLLGLHHISQNLPPIEYSTLLTRAKEVFISDPDSGVHAAAEFILRTSGEDETLNQMSENCPSKGNWRILPNGLCMIRIEAPGTIDVGTTPATDDSDGVQPHRTVKIDYAFEVSSTEITVQQMHEYIQSTQPSATVSFSRDSPMGRVTLFEAMKFCRLLSEQEPDFNPDHCCYPSVSEIGPDMHLLRGFLLRPGYRLPTVHEWEYVVRADSKTSRFFGNSPDLLNDYAWWVHNSAERLWPVRMKRPNPWGLFDVYGNALEWCHEAEIDFVATGHPVRGGDYHSTQRFLRSSFADFLGAALRNPEMGFRVVKVEN